LEQLNEIVAWDCLCLRKQVGGNGVAGGFLSSSEKAIECQANDGRAKNDPNAEKQNLVPYHKRLTALDPRSHFLFTRGAV
jgi:hypothetical protein